MAKPENSPEPNLDIAKPKNSKESELDIPQNEKPSDSEIAEAKDEGLTELEPAIPEQVINVIEKELRIIEKKFSGPLPPPETLKIYNEVIPNGADRIMQMAEKQSEHRQALEKKALKTDSRNSVLGIISGFLIGIWTISIAGYVIVKGYSWTGTWIGSLGLFGLVYVFVYGTKSSREEREIKDKD